jgi:transposase
MRQNPLTGVMLQRPLPTLQAPQGLCLDKGYDYEEVRKLVAGLGFTAHLCSRGEEQRDIGALGYCARRWVVERTHGWLNRFLSLLVSWAKKAENYLALVHLACGIITWRDWSTGIGS